MCSLYYVSVQDWYMNVGNEASTLACVSVSADVSRFLCLELFCDWAWFLLWVLCVFGGLWGTADDAIDMTCQCECQQGSVCICDVRIVLGDRTVVFVAVTVIEILESVSVIVLRGKCSRIWEGGCLWWGCWSMDRVVFGVTVALFVTVLQLSHIHVL